ncbi:MAG: hypothetical protein KKD44_28150 [Proteobacteria bacterium]|nr:hypothetical protein [Pseudomonadota bacterium]
MTNLFKSGGPYEIAISQYGSTLADLPIRFGRMFGATYSPADWALGALLGGFVLYGALEFFLKKSPLTMAKQIPFIGPLIKKRR